MVRGVDEHSSRTDVGRADGNVFAVALFVGAMSESSRTLVAKWLAKAVGKAPTLNPICVDRRSGCKAGFRIELFAAEFIFASLSRPTPASLPEATPGAALLRQDPWNFAADWPLPRGIALGGDVR